MKFKIGDVVRIICDSQRPTGNSDWSIYMLETIGHVYKIEDINTGNQYGLPSDMRNDIDRMWWYHEDDLELYEREGIDAKGIISRAIGVGQ